MLSIVNNKLRWNYCESNNLITISINCKRICEILCVLCTTYMRITTPFIGMGEGKISDGGKDASARGWKKDRCQT